jgi:hypothetical protein
MNAKNQLSPKECKKDMFVVFQEGKNCFEIGMVKESANNKELKMWVLTAGGFPTNPPPSLLDKIHDPFLPNSSEMIALDKYPLYPLDDSLVIVLLDQQKRYLQGKLPESEAQLLAFEHLEESLLGVCISN